MNNIKEQINILNILVEQALSGNYNYEIDKSIIDDDFAILYNSLCNIIDLQKKNEFEIQVTASQIMAVSEDLNITLQDNNEFIANLYESSNNICKMNNRNHQNTISALHEIKDFVFYLENTKNSANKTIDISEKTKTVIINGISNIYKLLDCIYEVENTSNKTDDYITIFAASVQKIFKIAKSIEGILKQMELLSFNASIEARRAGIKGNCFAIIASEYRDLSQKSKVEVKDIYTIINEITTGMQQLTSLINLSSINVKESVKHSKSIVNSLEEIVSKYDDVTNAINEIYSVSQIQVNIANNVFGNITEIENNFEKFNNDFCNINLAIEKQKYEFEDLSNLGKCLAKASDSLSILISSSDENNINIDNNILDISAEKVFNLLKNNILNHKEFYSMDLKIHKELFDKLLNEDIIESVWSNYTNGKFVYSNPPAGITNARIREWFKVSINKNRYISKIYISAITKKPCITVSMPIIDLKGKLLGVIGADLRLNII